MIVEFYEDKSNKWRWRLKSNGRIMADSGEGYASKNIYASEPHYEWLDQYEVIAHDITIHNSNALEASEFINIEDKESEKANVSNSN